jgi:hypothetical protein
VGLASMADRFGLHATLVGQNLLAFTTISPPSLANRRGDRLVTYEQSFQDSIEIPCTISFMNNLSRVCVCMVFRCELHRVPLEHPEQPERARAAARVLEALTQEHPDAAAFWPTLPTP